jgi:hypothetical protein
MVRVYSGADATIIHEWRGAEENETGTAALFGIKIYGGGDLNADAVPDLMVAVPADPQGAGSIRVYSGETGERLWSIVGDHGADSLYLAAILGDLDPTGLSDFRHGRRVAFAVGDANTTGDTPAENYRGRVTVYAGHRGDLLHHCTAAPTSQGAGIELDVAGALSIGGGDLTLRASGAVPGQTARFLYGPPASPLPFGDGWLCTGPPVFRLGPALTVDPGGRTELALDFLSPPLSSGPGLVEPGSTWSFQLHCRDPQGPGGTGFNLSGGLAITFPP